jgi:hypothetical protein
MPKVFSTQMFLQLRDGQVKTDNSRYEPCVGPRTSEYAGSGSARGYGLRPLLGASKAVSPVTDGASARSALSTHTYGTRYPLASRAPREHLSE